MDENVVLEARPERDAAEIALDAVKEAGNILRVDKARALLERIDPAKIVTVIAAIVIFYLVYRVVKRIVVKNAAKRLQAKTVALIGKLISYCFYVAITAYVLELFGINLGVIWGAAGIAGVALGFAAQTSVSNLISGIFILTDKAMKIGDFIEVEGTSGTVDEAGLLSVKIRTLDNQLIRIPNSSIMNAKLINYSSFDYRRYVFELSIDYASDLDKALSALLKVPALCPTVIRDKEDLAPSAIFTTLGDSGINMNLIVWSERANFIQTKNDVCAAVLKVFREENISIPYNKLDVKLL